jgi:hypothetical protein
MFCRYHFVNPGTTVLYSDPDCSQCFAVTKRWDVLAFHEFGEIHNNFFTHFRCEVTGGAGGAISSSTTVLAASVAKASKSAQKQKELADESQKQFIKDLVSAIRPVTLCPGAQFSAELLQVSSTLRELVASQDDEDSELITHYRKRKAWLRCDVFLSILIHNPAHPPLPLPFFQRQQILIAESSFVD